MRFDMICEANGIEHRLTKPNHPWSHEDQKTVRGTVFPRRRSGGEGNGTAPSKTRRSSVSTAMTTTNSARRHKTLGGLTPYEYICKIWTSKSDRFILNPIHQMPGLNAFLRCFRRRI